MNICKVQGCTTLAKKKGWCYTHYSRWYRWGTTDDPIIHINCLGHIYGRWTVISGPYGNDRLRKWECRCLCGTVRKVSQIALRSNRSKSCGCHGAELTIQRNTTHGEARRDKQTTLYKRWFTIHQRCYNQNTTHYHRYGGRGITVCEEWWEYTPFRDWALTNGFQEGLTIERINNDGNYCPENCTWILRSAQARNTKRTRWLTIWDETKSMVEWSEDPRCLVTYHTLCTRITDLGKSPEEALTTPARAHRTDGQNIRRRVDRSTP